jgi:predicted kinase
MLVVQMHGVPGSGKSTIARAIGPELGAIVLDKDVIKAALLRVGIVEQQAAVGGYEAYFDLATHLVRMGHSVILDNPVAWPTVEAKWRAIAQLAGSPPIMIECVCGDEDELARRLETRDALESQPRAPFVERRLGAITMTCERLILDTTRPLDDCVDEALAYVRAGVPA